MGIEKIEISDLKKQKEKGVRGNGHSDRNCRCRTGEPSGR